jgi:AraC-like DNA-binding protein
MDINSQITFFNYLYNINNIPLCVFQDESLLLQIPITKGFVKRIQPYFDSLKEQNEKITYMATSYEALYGLVRIEENNLWAFVGPYFTIPVTADSLPTIIEKMDIKSAAEEADMKIFLRTLPTGPLHRFLSYLSCIYASLGHDIIPVEDIAGSSSERRSADNIQQIYTNKKYDDQEVKAAHSTYLHEMHRLELIANGDVESMKKNTISMLPGQHGWIGTDALRQAKNIFIAACTLYTRAAIAGGLDAEEAYNLSDIYIRTCESYSNVSDIERLQRKMPLDFAERVESEVKLKDVSKPIVDAVHYIKEHIAEPLQATDIAEHVNLSTSYFLKRFKSETGTGVSEFITKARIEEACMLLSYTDKSLTEISNYLYFSSQSYFQNVFKKTMGVTPGQYRNSKRAHAFPKSMVP